MAWQEPNVNWPTEEEIEIAYEDFNRIEGNIADLHTRCT